MKKHLLTIGLRRSGTTVFWQLFRQDKRFLSFDEPFNSLFYLSANGRENSRKSDTEFAAHRDFFLQWGSHIDPCQEVAPLLFGHQITYLKKMFELNSHVNVNVTRLHNKIDIIRKLLPDVFIVLLIRDPRAWVTSQLKPKGCWVKGTNLPENFFNFTGGFDHWRYQYISALNDYQGFAHEKLMQCWKALNYAAIDLKPDMIIQFEDFCSRPGFFALEIYKRLDLLHLDVPLSDHISAIHKPNKPYKLEDNHQWCKSLAKYKIYDYIWDDWDGCEESKDYL